MLSYLPIYLSLATHRSYCYSLHISNSCGTSKHSYIGRERRLETWLALLPLQTLNQSLIEKYKLQQKQK